MIKFSECIILPIDQIHPAPYNPRVTLTHDDVLVKRLRDSIKDGGALAAIVWNRRTGNAVGGNIRLMAYQLLGVARVPANVVDLPLEDEMTLNIALNRIAGEFDAVKYQAALKRMADAGMDSIKAGVTQAEIAALTGSFDFSAVPALSEMTYNPPTRAMYKCPCCGFTDERKRFKKAVAE
ncbi:MAG: ParB N-terminal domain-containing protein [Clostridia bacterium]|nr:ParB N-terminal domain-containing protein [Clostridia bacterium]